MTLAQYNHCIAGYNSRIKYQIEMQDYLNHSLGQYIAIGVNDPKKYPHSPMLQKEKKRWLSNEEIMNHAKAMTIQMGGTVN